MPHRKKYVIARLTTPVEFQYLEDAWRTSTRQEFKRMMRGALKGWPLRLYHFQSLHRKFDAKNLRAILIDSVLRLNAPSTFNDPFELCAYFVIEGTPEERREKFQRIAHLKVPRPSADQRQTLVEEMMRTPDHEFTRRNQRTIRKMQETSGVFSFAGNPYSPLMWSHYAKDHQGICLTFERTADFPTFAHAVRIKYSREYPIINWIKGVLGELIPLLNRKHPAWKYERESRITVIDGAEQYVTFRSDALREIILGTRCTMNIVRAVDRILAQRAARGMPKVAVRVAAQHPTKYRLVIRKRRPGETPPWTP